ncbi:MAG: FAD-dependent oxidoreductase [Archangium sp.]
METYELIVIGAGPAGQKAALQAAKLKKKVAVIEREREVGGSCVSTGTLPSKTLRETVHSLTQLRRRQLINGKHTTMTALMERKEHVVTQAIDVIQSQLDRNGVDVVRGNATFLDAHTLRVQTRDGMKCDYRAAHIIIATGSRPARIAGVDTSDSRILDSDSVLDLDNVPRSLTVLGGGVIGCEYACIFAAVGTKVTLVDRRNSLLRFLDGEISSALAYQMRSHDITLRLGEELKEIKLVNGSGRVETHLKSGKMLPSEKLLCAMGRQSNVEGLGLEALGIAMSSSGLIEVNEHYQTRAHPHVYAVGDVIGFPALASTSMEQGRLAACHALGEKCSSMPKSFPYGIYTIPEISFAGATEEELTKTACPTRSAAPNIPRPRAEKFWATTPAC